MYVNYGHDPGWRDWEDARLYGFVCAGGGAWYTTPLRRLREGERIWAFAPGYGYVGAGLITGEAQRAEEFTAELPGGVRESLREVLGGPYANDRTHTDEAGRELFVPVRWLETRPAEWAVWEQRMFANPAIVCRPTSPEWYDTVETLRQQFPNYDRFD